MNRRIDIVDPGKLPTVPTMGVSSCGACPLFLDEAGLWCTHPAVGAGARVNMPLIAAMHRRATWCPLEASPLTLEATEPPDDDPVADEAALAAVPTDDPVETVRAIGMLARAHS